MARKAKQAKKVKKVEAAKAQLKSMRMMYAQLDRLAAKVERQKTQLQKQIEKSSKQ